MVSRRRRCRSLVRYSWPGNVRELMNAVERAVVLSRTETVDEDELIFTMADQMGVLNDVVGKFENSFRGRRESFSGRGGKKKNPGGAGNLRR